MKPEDVSAEWVEKAINAAAQRPPLPYDAMRHALAAVLPLAVAEEREACAKVADAYASDADEDPRWDEATSIAAAIRARGDA